MIRVEYPYNYDWFDVAARMKSVKINDSESHKWATKSIPNTITIEQFCSSPDEYSDVEFVHLYESKDGELIPVMEQLLDCETIQYLYLPSYLLPYVEKSKFKDRLIVLSVYQEMNNLNEHLSFDFSLPNLQYLAAQRFVVHLNKENLPNLVCLQCTSVKNPSHLEEMNRLRALGMIKVNKGVFDHVTQLTHLEYLMLLNGTLMNIDSIQNCMSLRSLSLNTIRKLDNIAPLQHLTLLEFLEIKKCPKISDWSVIEHLPNLKRLWFEAKNSDELMQSLSVIRDRVEIIGTVDYR